MIHISERGPAGKLHCCLHVVGGVGEHTCDERSNCPAPRRSWLAPGGEAIVGRLAKLNCDARIVRGRNRVQCDLRIRGGSNGSRRDNDHLRRHRRTRADCRRNHYIRARVRRRCGIVPTGVNCPHGGIATGNASGGPGDIVPGLGKLELNRLAWCKRNRTWRDG